MCPSATSSFDATIAGYGIFNYRGERVLDLPMRTANEAERLAAEIVSPWKGRVRVETTR